MKATTPKYIDIKQADYKSGCKVRLRFTDGMVRVFDFEPFLRHAKHPDLIKYRSLKRFQAFHVKDGNIMWGDYDMIFPVADLYRGEL